MKQTRILMLFLLSFVFTASSGQVKRWTLQECIDYATSNNLQIGQNNLQVRTAENNLLTSKANVLPSINGQSNYTYNTGRRIDPFTNTFANSRVLSQNYSVSSNVNLFTGFTNTQTILANQLSVIAAKYNNEQLKNNIALNVTNAFLQIILADELLIIATNQQNLTKDQSARGKLLYEAGRTAKGDFLQTEAQLATEELNVVNARNRLELTYLTIVQLLALETTENFEIVKPDFSKTPIELPAYNVRNVYLTAVSNQPGILGADYQVKSAEHTLKAVRGNYYPSLSAFGGLGTGYSELSRKIIGYDTQSQNIGSINGQPINIDVQVPITELTPFSDQVNQNFNRTFGLSLNVPILNGFATRSRVTQQKIALDNAKLNSGIAKNQLLLDIQTAYFDAKSAFERYRATEKSVLALQEAFTYIQQRFDVGMVNAFEYTTSKNQLTSAQSNLAQARYEFILRVKVLDFYQGKPITL